MAIHATAIATDRPACHPLSLSALVSWCRMLDAKLARQLANSRLQCLDRRMLADFVAENLASDVQQSATPMRDDCDGLCVLFAATRFAK